MAEIPRLPEQPIEDTPKTIHNHYYGPINVDHIGNAVLGPNHGTITQAPPPPAPVTLTGIAALLSPIPHASHTRNRRVAPPDSACLPGTRKKVLKKIISWVDRNPLLGGPHIIWVYGYAGCGKSAIAQAIAEHFAGKRRLAGSFFFFRNSGDRDSVESFAATIASQIAAAIPAVAPIIESAVKANPGVATTATSLPSQFQQLIYDPIDAIKWDKIAAAFRNGPFLIVLDGLDECKDRDEIAALIHHMIEYFKQKPRIPLRFLITSRVEQHIHQQLHSTGQVQLLNLVDHTSDADIATALDIRIATARRNRVLACQGEWPSPQEKDKLIAHIGGSFIFMTTITRYLFDAAREDRLTPVTRLPRALQMSPGFDGIYRSILGGSSGLPHFQDVVGVLALAARPLSILELSDLLAVASIDVTVVLTSLHAIVQVPGDDRIPVTLWHTSLRDFLTSESRSGSLYASPTSHRSFAYRHIALCASPNASPAFSYTAMHAVVHWRAFLRAVRHDLDALIHEMGSIIALLRSVFHAMDSTEIIAAYVDISHRVNLGPRALHSILGDLYPQILPRGAPLASLVGELLDPFLANHGECSGRTAEEKCRSAKPQMINCNSEDLPCTGGFHDELYAHIQDSHTQLLDSHHMDVVLQGVSLMVGLCISDLHGLILHVRGDFSRPSGEYMLVNWARHLGLAIQANPEHPAFDPVDPTLIPIPRPCFQVSHSQALAKEPSFVIDEMAELNIAFAEKTVKYFVNPEALTKGLQWWCDTSGPRPYAYTQATREGYSVTVYDVLSGLRALVSGAASHPQPSSSSSTLQFHP